MNLGNLSDGLLCIFGHHLAIQKAMYMWLFSDCIGDTLSTDKNERSYFFLDYCVPDTGFKP